MRKLAATAYVDVPTSGRLHDMLGRPRRMIDLDEFERRIASARKRSDLAGAADESLVGRIEVLVVPPRQGHLRIRYSTFVRARTTAVSIASPSARDLWLYRGFLYSTAERLTPQDATALLHQMENRLSTKVARAKALMEQVAVVQVPGRPLIPDDVKVLVWQRDGGHCVRCGSSTDLEFDHIIPYSLGGATTFRNLQLLCESCNRAKGGSLA